MESGGGSLYADVERNTKREPGSRRFNLARPGRWLSRWLSLHLAVVFPALLAINLTFTTPAQAQPLTANCWEIFFSASSRECYATPTEACESGKKSWSGVVLSVGWQNTTQWMNKTCLYVRFVTGVPISSTRLIRWFCADGNFAQGGKCPGDNLPLPAKLKCDTPRTPYPIDILTGAKQFEAEDYSNAAGLSLTRFYTSAPYRGGGSTLHIGNPAGLANWMFDFQFELQIGPDWTNKKAVSLMAPQGASLAFQRQTDGSLKPLSGTFVQPQVDYALALAGSWPSDLNTLANTSTQWTLTQADGTVWTLQTFVDASTGTYSIARPISRVTTGGGSWALSYGPNAELTSIVDNFGNELSFDWIINDHSTWGGPRIPRAISAVRLPDGRTISYVYSTVGSNTTGAEQPDRLSQVQYRDANNVVQDQVTYEYNNASYLYAITAVLDKDGVTRWTVTYDADGRATNSSGPGGAHSTSVAYGALGSTFMRTVTNPLGKETIYTWSNNSSGLRLTGTAGQASTNCPSSATSVTYGGDGFVSSTTNENGVVTTYANNSRGLPTQVVEASGTSTARQTDTTWHSSLNQATQVQSPGLTVDVTYASGTAAGPFVPPAFAATQNFAFTGSDQTYSVPTGMTSATIELWGGAGGNGNYDSGAWSGAGGYLKATFAVVAGDTLKFEIGGGGQGAAQNANGGGGGWPDGGSGARGNRGSGGGGGSSRFYVNNVLMAVVGGGGGSGGRTSGGSAGAGGGVEGQGNSYLNGGSGGKQDTGGLDLSDATNANKTGRSITSYPGAQRTGGWGGSTGDNTTTTTDDGGGGGGGYWGGGGGGGDGQAGGGGSSWIHFSARSVLKQAGNRQTPGLTPSGQPTVATGVNSAANGAAVAGGAGYATLGLR